MPGGDNGGTAALWDAASAISNAFRAVAWDSLLLPNFRDGRDSEATALDELVLPMVDKNLSFDRVVGADAITELKTPDSLKPWMMAWKKYGWRNK